MNEPDNLPERVSRLEQSVADARKDAAAARILAGGADRDVSEMRTELKAHTKLLNALRETQVEQGQEMRQGFATVESRFAKVEGDMREGFSEVNGQLAETRQSFAAVESRFAKVEGDMREGFAQTRKGFADVRSEMGAGFADVRSEMGAGFADVRSEMGAGFADVRSEMREGFALLKEAIEKTDDES